MEEYKSNSHKARERKNEPVAEKKVEKIISGSVKSKKKSGLQNYKCICPRRCGRC